MEDSILIALLLITGLATLIPVLAKRLDRFGVPIVVYEILAGMVIGISGLISLNPRRSSRFWLNLVSHT